MIECDTEARRDDDVLRKLTERLEMMKQGLLDETSLLHSMGVDVALDFVTGGVGGVRRDLRFSHSYKNVDDSETDRHVSANEISRLAAWLILVGRGNGAVFC